MSTQQLEPIVMTPSSVSLSKEAVEQHEKNQTKRLSVSMAPGRRMSVASTQSFESNAQRRQSRVGLAVSNLMGMGGATRRMSRVVRGAASENIREALVQPKPPPVENTYRMEPKENEHFGISKVEQTVKNTLELFLKNETYDRETAPQLTCELCTMIKNRVKDLEMPRYKTVVNVLLGEINGQGLEAASRCLWNPQTDNYACVNYKNSSLFATVTVHAFYFE